MKFFIDTANLDQIREAHDLGVLDGVTTNPSLMAKEGIKGVENQRRHYVEICNIVQGDARRAWRDYGTHLLLIIVMITSAYLIEKSRFLE